MRVIVIGPKLTDPAESGKYWWHFTRASSTRLVTCNSSCHDLERQAEGGRHTEKQGERER